MKKYKKVKEPVSDLFVRAIVNELKHYGDYEYTSEMLNVGVTERQLPAAVLDFALDAAPPEFHRLTSAEQDEVEKRLKKYFKESLS
jgi:hypothetical protein